MEAAFRGLLPGLHFSRQQLGKRRADGELDRGAKRQAVSDRQPAAAEGQDSAVLSQEVRTRCWGCSH